MKRYFYFVIFFLASIYSKAQIVNNQFEDWTNVGAYDSLNHWTTDNFLVPTCALKDTVTPQSGLASLKLVTCAYNGGALPGGASTGGFVLSGITVDLSQGGQPDSVRHTFLKGYYKYAPLGGAVGSVEVVLLKRNGANRDTIGYGKLEFTSQTSYTAFTVPLTFVGGGNPDTSIVYFQSSGRTISDVFNTLTIGSTLEVDSIYFDGITGIHELHSNLLSINAFPNPVSGLLTIESKWKTAVRGTVSVLDINGKLLQSTPLMDNKQRIDISMLANGNYFYELMDEKGTKLYTGKFSVSH